MKTFGTITVTKEGAWHIEAGPFILARIKRAFPGQCRRQHGKSVEISPSKAKARDLAWFCERYPFDFADDARAQIEQMAADHRSDEAAVGSILDGTWERPPAGKRGFELRFPLRDYQQQSVDMVHATGCVLNTDALGLGKSAQAIGTLTNPKALPAVIVVKSHLMSQWANEVQKFAPNLKVKVLKGRTPYSLHKEGRGRIGRAPDVVIVNFHCLAAWADTLAAWARSMIIDEMHELRRPESNKYAGASCIAKACDYRSGYTATPVMNYADEVIALYGIIAPEALGTREEFRAEWGMGGDSSRISDPAALGQWLRDNGLMIGRTRKDVGRELPPVNRVSLSVDANPADLSKIEGQAGEFARIILASGGFSQHERINAGQQMLNLIRQATGIAKAAAVAEHVRGMLEEGEKVILTGWHRAVYDIWGELLKEHRPAFYTGTESTSAKDESRRKFIEGETNLLVMSNRSGEGLNGLQDVCRVIVFGELDWSPKFHDQLVGRLNRDGQTEAIFAYYAVADTGSDPILADILGAKQADSDGFMGEAAEFSPERLGQAAIEEMARAFFVAADPADAVRAPTVRPAREVPVPRIRVARETTTPVQLGLMSGLAPKENQGDSQ